APRAALDGAPVKADDEEPSRRPSTLGSLRAAVSRSALGRFFDGGRAALNGAKDDEEEPGTGAFGEFDAFGPSAQAQATPDDLSEETADPAAEDLEVRFTFADMKALKDSRVFATARVIRNAGSEWYWGRFEKGAALRVLAGGRKAFNTRVEDGVTKTIGEMQREDFRGIYPASSMDARRGGKLVWTAERLRGRLIKDLAARQRDNRKGMPVAVTDKTKVRIVRFMKASEAEKLPENQPEAAPVPVARNPVTVPARLAVMSRMLPKLVLMDLRLFPQGLPSELLEDMGKLMRAGVFFVFFTDGADEAARAPIMKALDLRPKDGIIRHKFITLSDDGNSATAFVGGFPRRIPTRRFDASTQERLSFALFEAGGTDVRRAGSDLVSAAVPAGMTAKELQAAFARNLEGLGLDPASFSMKADENAGRLTVRPTDLAGSAKELYRVLRDDYDLYVTPSDTLLVTEDPAVRMGYAGAIDAAEHTPARGVELAETTLAGALGSYRENHPRDVAASATYIESFKRGQTRDQKPGGDEGGSIYMLLGHVMHASFNWAVWRYRETGRLPGIEETLEKSREIWHRKDNERIRSLLDRSGQSTAGYFEIMEARMRVMHRIVVGALEAFPIAIGTELPNLLVFERYTKGEESGRDILRTIFDFAVARKVKDGLEVAVLDFKTGQTPTLQNLSKATQPMLYDAYVQRNWKTVAAPYGANGKEEKVVKTHVTFIYPNQGYEAKIDEWSRLKFEKTLRLAMARIRAAMYPKPPKAAKTAPAKAKAPAKTVKKPAPKK
ncbi:MAG: hypothetical protein KGL53_09525, partial [Elusimicrobia bacterium]|nr:hypothetical protein [Elusimicrobiota bacterium]